MEQLFSEQFMMAYASVMGFFSLMLVIPLVMVIYLVCRNKFLSTSYKLGWIVSFLFFEHNSSFGLLGCVLRTQAGHEDVIMFVL